MPHFLALVQKYISKITQQSFIRSWQWTSLKRHTIALVLRSTLYVIILGFLGINRDFRCFLRPCRYLCAESARIFITRSLKLQIRNYIGLNAKYVLMLLWWHILRHLLYIYMLVPDANPAVWQLLLISFEHGCIRCSYFCVITWLHKEAI
jgi:hypothetical protein